MDVLAFNTKISDKQAFPPPFFPFFLQLLRLMGGIKLHRYRVTRGGRNQRRQNCMRFGTVNHTHGGFGLRHTAHALEFCASGFTMSNMQLGIILLIVIHEPRYMLFCWIYYLLLLPPGSPLSNLIRSSFASLSTLGTLHTSV